MKTQKEIKNKLWDLYEHRLNVRYKNLLKVKPKNCINCKIINKTNICQLTTEECNKTCSKFKLLNNRDNIKIQFDAEIKDPKICGCKEPKIAILLWILHSNKPPVKISLVKKILRGILK